jgi:hypothetical protein
MVRSMSQLAMDQWILIIQDTRKAGIVEQERTTEKSSLLQTVETKAGTFGQIACWHQLLLPTNNYGLHQILTIEERFTHPFIVAVQFTICFHDEGR